MATHSTVEVAEMVGVSWDTLSRWIREKKFPVPPVKSVGRVRVRLWNDTEIAAVRTYKKEHYRGKGSRKVRRKKT
ncbi:MAG: helix-turn-helix domain-containing protein [Candidatus Acidiferrales bacterium]